MTPEKKEELLDLLLDLQHDLGKYIRLPLAFLPKEADQESLRLALNKALLQTRSGPTGVVTAEQLWQAFLEAVGEDVAFAKELQQRLSFRQLKQSVAQALIWQQSLTEPAAELKRSTIEKDLGRVTQAIRSVIQEVAGDV